MEKPEHGSPNAALTAEKKAQDPRRWRWEMALKLATLALAVGGAVKGYGDYRARLDEADRRQKADETAKKDAETQHKVEQDKYIEQRERELTEKFREHQLQLYLEGASAAATLATATDLRAPAVADARSKFLNLYWGPMSVVEDSLTLPDGAAAGPVELAMVRFGAALAKCGIVDPRGTPLPPLRADAKCTVCLHKLSLDLAHTFRQDVQREWRLTLPGPPEQEEIQDCRTWAEQ